MSLLPWHAANIIIALKQNEEPQLSDAAVAIAAGTATYEQMIRELWDEYKKNPSKAAAQRFAEELKLASNDTWPTVFAQSIGIELDDLTERQLEVLDEELDKHHDYIDNSLKPDLLTALDNGQLDFSNMDYRVMFMYAGALWSVGFLATIMFDGLSLRDLADVFMFIGPKDENTCTGERGCEQFANNFYTVAEILARDIIPGRLRCLTNCRHMLLPVASPLSESTNKHLSGQHDQSTHGRGGTGLHGKSLAVLSGDPNMDVHARVTEVYNGTIKDFNFIADEVVGIRYEGDGQMTYSHDTGELRMSGFLSKFDPETLDRIIDGWGETTGTLKGGLQTTLEHELGHAVHRGIQKKLLAQGGSANDKFFDTLESMRDNLGFPSEYAKRGTGEWVAERYALERTGRAEPVVVDYLKSFNPLMQATKHLQGQHDQSTHGRGGGATPKVWDGQPVKWEGKKLTKLQVGEIGENLAMRVLSEQMGVEFKTLNAGLNNAPIDVGGDHTAVEVKTGLASNGRSAQQWRATIGQPGKAETAALKQMTREEKRVHNQYKKGKILERKQNMLDEMSKIAGAPVKGATVGIILHPDGTKGDVYKFDGFHLRVPWKKANELGEFLGTFNV